MRHRHRTSSQTTLVTSTSPGELSPIEGGIMDACNALHAARERDDHARSRELTEELFRLLDAYDASDGDNHPNPAWSRPNQRALALSAMGRTGEAIEAERVALKYADTPRRKEISLGNLADRYLRLGMPDEAVECFLRAWTVAPHSIPIMLTGVQALYEAGRPNEANAIAEALLDMPELLHEGSELTAYLDYEPKLRRIDLPAINELRRRWNAARPGAVRSEGGAS